MKTADGGDVWYGEPCGHEPSQGAAQLHGICVFCWRDRGGAAILSLQRERDEAVKLLAGMVREWHTLEDSYGDGSRGDVFHYGASFGRSSILYLARIGKLEIIGDDGNQVIGRWKQQEAHDEKA